MGLSGGGLLKDQVVSLSSGWAFATCEKLVAYRLSAGLAKSVLVLETKNSLVSPVANLNNKNNVCI